MISRSRNIQPAFFTSADVRALPLAGRLTFLGLLFYVDDYGNESADAALVKAAIWPTDSAVTVAKVQQHFALLEARGMVTFYEVAGRQYMRITNWDKHMRVDRPSRSHVPPDPARERLVATEGGVGDGSGREGDVASDDVWVSDEGGREPARESGPPSPFCPAHPNGTTKACKACGNARLSLKAWELAREAES